MAQQPEVTINDAATGDGEGAQPPGIGGAVPNVWVTVIPTHSPVDETKGTGKAGRRVLVLDYGPDDVHVMFDHKLQIRSFPNIKEARAYRASLQKLGHLTKISRPGKARKKASKRTLNERLAGGSDD